MNATDVLSELSDIDSVTVSTTPKVMLTPIEQYIHDSIGTQRVDIDSLVTDTYSISQVMVVLSQLEMKGLVAISTGSQIVLQHGA